MSENESRREASQALELYLSSQHESARPQVAADDSAGFPASARTVRKL